MAHSTVVNPASRNSCICAGARLASHSTGSPDAMWRWASMNPGITVRPCASMRVTPDGTAPEPTDAILPPRTTTEPRSMTPPLPSRMRAFTMARSCAAVGGESRGDVKSVSTTTAIGGLTSISPCRNRREDITVAARNQPPSVAANLRSEGRVPRAAERHHLEELARRERLLQDGFVPRGSSHGGRPTPGGVDRPADDPGSDIRRREREPGADAQTTC